MFLITLKNIAHYYYNGFEENIYIYIYIYVSVCVCVCVCVCIMYMIHILFHLECNYRVFSKISHYLFLFSKEKFSNLSLIWLTSDAFCQIKIMQKETRKKLKITDTYAPQSLLKEVTFRISYFFYHFLSWII